MKNKMFIKTYFYSQHEYPFLIAQLHEMKKSGCVDKLIIYEYNVHHTGKKREFIFDWNEIPKEFHRDIYYCPANISEFTEETDDEDIIHSIHEPIMRTYLVYDKDISCTLNIQDHDVIINVDADEIIYAEFHASIKDHTLKNGCTNLPLNQFFYRPEYLWKNKEFKSPTACLFKDIVFGKNTYVRDYPANSFGLTRVGAHMSWCMPIDDMITKLHVYGHPKYRSFADRDILEKAVNTKTYPFDPSVNFQLEELSWADKRIPQYIRESHENMLLS